MWGHNGFTKITESKYNKNNNNTFNPIIRYLFKMSISFIAIVQKLTAPITTYTPDQMFVIHRSLLLGISLSK
jgi:hypothetical protein